MLPPLGKIAVYPCTHRERFCNFRNFISHPGISLYPQGTPKVTIMTNPPVRYIPVPTGNAQETLQLTDLFLVYPCTHRERIIYQNKIMGLNGISLYPQGTQCVLCTLKIHGRYIPVPTGNAP